jgi:hypothetical protein
VWCLAWVLHTRHQLSLDKEAGFNLQQMAHLEMLAFNLKVNPLGQQEATLRLPLQGRLVQIRTYYNRDKLVIWLTPLWLSEPCRPVNETE